MTHDLYNFALILLFRTTDPLNPLLLAQFGSPRATILSGRCAILGIPVFERGGGGGGPTRIILLIDATTGRLFAHYPAHSPYFKALTGW